MDTTRMCRYRAWLLASSGAMMLGAATLATSASAQDAGPVEEVVVTGSRFGPRIVTDSPTPIDSISQEELARGGGADLQSQIKVVVPSFSTPKPTAAGAQDFITPPTLRGLSPGQLLVLVNGKRRHTSSELNVSNQIGRGDVAYDFNAIPTAALARIEVLRDGASAQYGSDAIAGVLNLQLDDRPGFDAQASYGATSKGDGEDLKLSIGQGFAIGDGGFVRITGQYQDHNFSDRARPDTRQQYFGASATGAPLFPSANFGSATGVTPSAGRLDPREATFDRDVWKFGDPSYTNTSIFLNSAVPLSSTVTAYAFGGYNRLKGTSFNFFRRAGQDETVRAIHPNGFLPLQNIKLENYSAAAGVRGENLAGFAWDFSTIYGESNNHIGYSDSNNVSLGAASPTTFYRGGPRFRQWTSNLDLTRQFDMPDGSPLKLALGLEYRKEFYELRAGELASYVNGPFAILDGPNAGRPAPVGAQPGGGINPSDAADADRDSKAAYVEVEKQFFDERLLISGALRYEDFSDFGDTTNYKIAGRFELIDGLAVRGSYGSGFRAPALAQSYYSSTNIVFANGEPLRVRVVAVDDPIAPLIGASPLKPEESKNLSLGVVFNRGPFSATVDYYRIKITDRIVISSNFQSAGLTNFLASQGFPSVSAVAYLTNAVDTTTEGVDLTARYRHDMGGAGSLTAMVSANFNESSFDRIAGTPAILAPYGITASLFDLSQQVRFTQSMPEDKIGVSLAWEREKLSVNLTATRYGQVAQVALTGRSPAQVAALTPGYDTTLVPSAPGTANSDIIQRFGADIVADLELSYRVTERLRATVGASNLFDKYPDENIASTAASVAAGTNGSDNAGIFPYSSIAPYGFNGRFLYMKLGYKF